MEFLVAHWIEVVLVLILVAAVGYFAYLVYTKQLDKAQKWLLLMVDEAERFIGSGNGQKKLQFVYDKFTNRYPVISLFVSFERFSKMVDIALEELEQLIKNK